MSTMSINTQRDRDAAIGRGLQRIADMPGGVDRVLGHLANTFGSPSLKALADAF